MTTAERADLAGTAANIMFSGTYLRLLRDAYTKESSIQEFERNPRVFLARHGIEVPAAIEIVIHRAGGVGKPGRVDFHWDEKAQAPRAKGATHNDSLVQLAHIAWDTLHDREMQELLQSVRRSAAALQEFAADPMSYAKAHGVRVPEGMQVIVHTGQSGAPYVDIHFPFPEAMRNARAPEYDGGCCYCRDGGCCYYAD
jgi:hypothetical protein